MFLGTSLFPPYTMDLFSILENALIGYANDSFVICSVLPGVTIAESPSSDLGKVSDWYAMRDEIECE